MPAKPADIFCLIRIKRITTGTADSICAAFQPYSVASMLPEVR